MSRSVTGRSIDWITLTLYFSLLIIGWLMLYAAVYDENVPKAFLDINTTIGKQSLWVVISLLVFLVGISLDWKFWNTFAYPIYIFSLILLIAVLLFGTEIKGAQSWFKFGSISFQPSEFAKLGTTLALASYLSFYKSDIRFGKSLLISISLFLAPATLILLQPDAGSTIVFLSFFILLFRKGLSPIYFIIFGSLAAILILSLIFGPLIVIFTSMCVVLIILVANRMKSRKELIPIGILILIASILQISELEKLSFIIIGVSILTYSLLLFLNRKIKILQFLLPILLTCMGFSYGSSFAFNNILEAHQQERINVWLQPKKCDPRGSLYNITQSKLAIGSGGFEGKGFLKGDMTKLNYVPEQTTDFIFSTVGEEQGFLGSIGIIFLFTLMLIRMTIIAERSRSEFIRNVTYGIAGIFFIHFFINIGMSVGLMPVIGIPLPFLSKGGSSLVIFTLMVAMVLRMDMARFR